MGQILRTLSKKPSNLENDRSLRGRPKVVLGRSKSTDRDRQRLGIGGQQSISRPCSAGSVKAELLANLDIRQQKDEYAPAASGPQSSANASKSGRRRSSLSDLRDHGQFATGALLHAELAPGRLTHLSNGQGNIMREAHVVKKAYEVSEPTGSVLDSRPLISVPVSGQSQNDLRTSRPPLGERRGIHDNQILPPNPDASPQKPKAAIAQRVCDCIDRILVYPG